MLARTETTSYPERLTAPSLHASRLLSIKMGWSVRALLLLVLLHSVVKDAYGGPWDDPDNDLLAW